MTTNKAESTTDSEPEAVQVTDAPTAGRGLVWALALAVLAGLIALAVVASGRSGGDDLQQGRDDVRTAAEQFVLRIGTYSPDMLADDGTMPEYRDGMNELMTEKMRASFENGGRVVEQLVKQSGVSRSADVYASGVSTIDQDSAEVIVAGAFTDSYPKADPREPTPVRMRITLRLVDGDWLVDDFGAIGANQ